MVDYVIGWLELPFDLSKIQKNIHSNKYK